MPYFSVSLGLNILLTAGIVIRLLVFRRRITSAFGPAHGSHYTSIISIIVESAALYSAFSIFFIIPFARNSLITGVPMQLIGQVQGFATLLIVHRVASGIAWSSDTNSFLTTHNELRGTHMPTFAPPTSVLRTNTIGSFNANGTHCADERGSILACVGVTKFVETDVVSISDSMDIASHRDMNERV